MAGLGPPRRGRVGRPAGQPSGSTRSPTTSRAASLLASLVRTTTYSADTSLLDAGAATAQLRTAMHGVLYLHHGWSSLVDGLADVVRANGGVL